ncbi:MAG: S-methyl-5-thioribose-1-phosphate isomerase, partial [Dehalococcoidia bacterium]|nr:S-methyl-5-thioribose-1-phosphate isomerase [Dehalococcoidia bacterium]
AAAAYGLVLAANATPSTDPAALRAAIAASAARLRATRPTAVNLFWAIDTMLTAIAAAPDDVDAIRAAAIATARHIADDDADANRAMGALGATLLPADATVLTHCNAGALATVEYGTALGVIRAGFAAGRVRRVFVDETRPLLQGARLTAWELAREGIPLTLITDSMAGYFLRKGAISCVIVGADRIAANGDVANKIGTYPLAVLARENGVPFYVAAPTSTIDLTVPDGDAIPIEERRPTEVTHCGGVPIAPPGVDAANPAFDVTPHRYVTAIVTEESIITPPFAPGLRATVEAARARRAQATR